MWAPIKKSDFRKPLSVPLCRVECVMPHSPFNRFLRRWTFVESQKAQIAEERASKTQPPQFLGRSLPFKLHSGAPRPLSQSEFQPNIAAKGYKRISPEFLELVQSHTVDDAALQRASRLRLNIAKRDAMSGRPNEHLTPELAAHLRNTMESRGINSYLYGIDFYDQSNTAARGGDDKLQYLDRRVIKQLCKTIKLDGTLDADQTRYLLNFLEALSDLGPQQITTYLTLLRANGVLTLSVLNVLNDLLERAGTKLFPRQLKMLTHVFGIMAEAATRAQQKLERMTKAEKIEMLKRAGKKPPTAEEARAAAKADIKRITGVWKGDHITGNWQKGRMKHDESVDLGKKLHEDIFNLKKAPGKSGYRQEDESIDEKDSDYEAATEQASREDLGSYDDAEFQMETEMLRDMTDSSGSQQLRDSSGPQRLRSRTLSFYTVPYPGSDGTKQDWYYPPWDVQVPWQGFQRFFQKALEKRLSRIDLSQLKYTRGIERYSREFKERNEPATGLKNENAGRKGGKRKSHSPKTLR